MDGQAQEQLTAWLERQKAAARAEQAAAEAAAREATRRRRELERLSKAHVKGVKTPDQVVEELRRERAERSRGGRWMLGEAD